MRINDLNKITNEDAASDLYHNNVKKVGQKDYNDYKGIQIHNLRKELKRVRKILLNLQDIESRDNSSDMVQDIRNMLGGYQDMLDNMESAFDKLEIGRHRKESVKEEVALTTPEEYRGADAANMQASKEILEKLMREIDLDIRFRSDNSDKFSNGFEERAGTGDLYRIKEQLEKLHASWDKETEIYFM